MLYRCFMPFKAIHDLCLFVFFRGPRVNETILLCFSLQLLLFIFTRMDQLCWWCLWFYHFLINLKSVSVWQIFDNIFSPLLLGCDINLISTPHLHAIYSCVCVFFGDLFVLLFVYSLFSKCLSISNPSIAMIINNNQTTTTKDCNAINSVNDDGFFT